MTDSVPENASVTEDTIGAVKVGWDAGADVTPPAPVVIGTSEVTTGAPEVMTGGSEVMIGALEVATGLVLTVGSLEAGLLDTTRLLVVAGLLEAASLVEAPKLLDTAGPDDTIGFVVTTGSLEMAGLVKIAGTVELGRFFVATESLEIRIFVELTAPVDSGWSVETKALLLGVPEAPAACKPFAG